MSRRRRDRQWIGWAMAAVCVTLLVYVSGYCVLSRRGLSVMQRSGSDYTGFWYVGMEPRNLIRDETMKRIERAAQVFYHPLRAADHVLTGFPAPDPVDAIDPDRD